MVVRDRKRQRNYSAKQDDLCLNDNQILRIHYQGKSPVNSALCLKKILFTKNSKSTIVRTYVHQGVKYVPHYRYIGFDCGHWK